MPCRRVAHLSGDMIEPNELPRRRAFSLSVGKSSNVTYAAVPCQSPLVLKSSSVSSVTSKDFVQSGDGWESVVGKATNAP